MEYQATAKYVHMSTRKVRLVADAIRKLSPAKALETLTLTPKFAPDNRQAVRGCTNPLRLLRVTQAEGCSSLGKATDGE